MDFLIFRSTGEYEGVAVGAESAMAALIAHATVRNLSGGTPMLTFFYPDSFRSIEVALGAVAEHTYGRRGGIERVAYVARLAAGEGA